MIIGFEEHRDWDGSSQCAAEGMQAHVAAGLSSLQFCKMVCWELEAPS